MHPRLRALLAAQIQTALRPRALAQEELHAALERARRAAAAEEDRLRAAAREAAALSDELRLWSQPFHAEMSVHHAWLRHPRAREVFARHHLPACDRCAVRFEETVGEAAAAYGLDRELLLAELNALLGGG